MGRIASHFVAKDLISSQMVSFRLIVSHRASLGEMEWNETITTLAVARGQQNGPVYFR
jgi:hypothetical protein